MSEGEVVDTIKCAVALLLLLTFSLFVSQHVVSEVKCFTLQVAVKRLIVNLLEQFLTLNLKQILLVSLDCVNLTLLSIFLFFDLFFDLPKQVVIVTSIEHNLL